MSNPSSPVTASTHHRDCNRCGLPASVNSIRNRAKTVLSIKAVKEEEGEGRESVSHLVSEWHLIIAKSKLSLSFRQLDE